MSEALVLRDIHFPDSVDWFPPAPGWWLLPIVLIALILLLRRLRKKNRSVRIDKSVKAEVEAVLARYRQDADAQHLIQQLSALLKRVGMTYLSREEVAAMSGVAWIERVDGLAGGRRFSPQVRELLATAPYRQQVEADASLIEDLINQMRRWCADLPARRGGRGHV